jgi:methionyl aminopeptidase
MIFIKNKQQIDGIRKSCQLASETLKHTSEFIKPGVSTQSLNDIAHQYIVSHNAVPAPLNYNGFPKSICTSVNNVVCHGIPSEKEILKNGDIINIDITTILDGYYGDVSATYPVGKIDAKATKLIDIVKKSLDKSISCLGPNKYLNDCVGKIIEPFVKKYGYSVVRELGGHGVGINFHEDPFVYHFDNNQKDVLLKPGMIFTVEPMINACLDWRIKLDKDDGWTIRSSTFCLSAQFEHTILITETGHEVLTAI